MTTNLSLVQKTAQTKLAGLVLIVLMLFLLAAPAQSAVAAPMFTSDGDGTLTVSPSSVAYDSSNTFDFTFTADTGDFIDGSQLVISIPDGWTPPSSSGAGRVTILSNTCTLRSPGAEIAGFENVSPMSVSVDFGCAQGESFTVRYAIAKATGVALYTFTSTTEIPGGVAPAEIAISPTIDVAPKMLTVGAAALSADNKVYDGTTDATFTNGDLSLVGITPGDTVTLDTSGGMATFADKHAANGKTVTFSGLTLAGVDAGNYELTQPTRTANITKLPITVTAVSDTKAYDGDNSSSGVPALSVGTPLAVGDVEPTWTQTFDNKNAGTGKSLIPAGLVDDGNSGLNYAYTYTPNTTGVITKLPITVTAVTDTKVYNGTTSSSGLPTLTVGTLATGDTEPVWTQTFDTKNVGANKVLTPAGLVVDGNNGLNYAYTYETVSTGEITAKSITVTADAKTKAYGAADPAFTYQVSPALASGDSFTGALTRETGTAPGIYNILQGTLDPGTNYAMTFVGATLTINPKITGNAGVGGATLKYNDGGIKTATANASGGYSLVVSYGWSGTVTPSRLGYTFLPATKTYTNVTANQLGQNYAARTERLKNGGLNSYIGFSRVPQFWTIANFAAVDGKTTTSVKEGTAAVVITGQANKTKTLSQTVTLSGNTGDKFTFSFWVRGQGVPVAGLCRAQVMLYDGATLKLTKTVNCSTSTYAYQQKILNFNAISAYTSIKVVITSSKASGTVWFDAISLVR